MQFSHEWLREWVVGAPPIAKLSAALTSGGLEVESVTPAAPTLSAKHFVVGKITRCEPHPTARKLTVCEVNIGRRENLTVICGAPNARADITVAVALVGATLPDTKTKIIARDIAGIKSNGMICSAAELGLDEDSTETVLELDTVQPGTPLAEHLNLTDTVIQLELTPNRGDCLGLRGIAREVCALTGAKMRATKIAPKHKPSRPPANKKHTLTVKLTAARECPRYVGCAVRDVDLSARTPDWMRERLRRGGVRSRNIAVDITNYVMLETGQPMHAFDMEKLSGGIIVRMAKSGERLTLLDGSTVKLAPDNLVIADHKKAVALAGIMGGHDSAIAPDKTRHIYFEAAFFPAAYINGHARRFGMHTDASHRFERGVDPTIQARAMQRATELLTVIAGGEVGAMTDAQSQRHLPSPVTIQFPRREIARLLGVTVPSNTVTALLKRLGMRVVANKLGWKVTVPSWRSDITGAHDLVEEVGRVYGFDNIKPRAPTSTRTTVTATKQNTETKITVPHIRQKLIERGYFEAITYSFVDAELQLAMSGARGIRLQNPIADNMTVMRRSLLPGLTQAVTTNLNRRHDRVRLFETGHVFLGDNKTLKHRTEVNRIAAVACGTVLPTQWGAPSRAVDFFDMKGDLFALLELSEHCDEVIFNPTLHPAFHPGRCAQLFIRGNAITRRKFATIGHLGQLHPAHQKTLGINQPVYAFELDLSVLQTAPLPAFTAGSKHPAVRRDLAVVVAATVQASDVLATVRAAAGDLLTELELFDIYGGEGVKKHHKSFAFRLTFQSQSSTLTAGQADEKTAKILARLKNELGAELRT